MDFDDTGLPWVLPSPNMPTLDTAFVYPGGCLLEGTNLSEGRGTTRPFEIFGAPCVDPDTLVGLLRGLEPARAALPAAASSSPPSTSTPARLCGGVQVHVTDRARLRPGAPPTPRPSRPSRELWPDHFAWHQPPYEYETEKLPIDILAGGPRWRAGGRGGAVALGRCKPGWDEELRRVRRA